MSRQIAGLLSGVTTTRRVSPASVRVAVLSVLLIPAACSSGGADLTTTAPSTVDRSTTVVTPSTELGDQDLAYASAYRSLMSTVAPTVWPGWGDPIPPLLQRGEASEYLIGHPDPLPGFEPTGATVAGAEIWSAPAGTLTPGPQATTWEVRGVWSAMIPLRRVFEEAVADVLGPDAVQWDDATYLRAVVHEAFHAHQLRVRPEFPEFGAGEIDEAGAVAALMEIPDLEQRFADEARLLALAIEAPDLASARDRARAFLEARQQRRGLVPRAVGAHEMLVEWAEGPARYADLGVLAAAGDRPPPAPGVELPGGEAVAEEYLTDLAATRYRVDGVRGWWQMLGSAQGMLLDRIYAGWKNEVLISGRALEELVDEGASVPDELAGLTVGRLRLGGTPFLVALALTPSEWSAGLAGIESLEPLDGMLFVFPEGSGGAAFHMDGALIPLDIAFLADDGALIEVMTMPLCSDVPCPLYRPDEPFRYALEAPAGALTGLGPTDDLDLPAGL
jgi:uncharacterized membrane protein (UPF0127 family)